MKAYIITIMGAALLSVFSDLILPRSWRKYVRMITGLIVISVIIAPVAKLRDIDLLRDFQLEETVIEEGQQDTGRRVAEELELRIAQDAAQRILDEFGIAVQVRVSVQTDAEYRIEYVKTMEITGKDLPAGVKERMQEVYDVREVIIHA